MLVRAGRKKGINWPGVMMFAGFAVVLLALAVALVGLAACGRSSSPDGAGPDAEPPPAANEVLPQLPEVEIPEELAPVLDPWLGDLDGIVERDDDAIKPFATFLGGSGPRCGQIRDAQSQFLFKDDAGEIGQLGEQEVGREHEGDDRNEIGRHGTAGCAGSAHQRGHGNECNPGSQRTQRDQRSGAGDGGTFR